MADTARGDTDKRLSPSWTWDRDPFDLERRTRAGQHSGEHGSFHGASRLLLGAPARLLGMRAAGQPVMRLVGFETGPMLRRAAQRFGWHAVLRDLWAAFTGARRRAKQGAHREPLA